MKIKKFKRYEACCFGCKTSLMIINPKLLNHCRSDEISMFLGNSIHKTYDLTIWNYQSKEPIISKKKNHFWKFYDTTEQCSESNGEIYTEFVVRRHEFLYKFVKMVNSNNILFQATSVRAEPNRLHNRVFD